MAEDYDAHTASLARQHFSAVRANTTHCMRCGLCCYQYPCIPRPNEIEPIANYLGLSLRELIDKYMVINTADCKVYFLRWSKHGEEDIVGKMIPPARTFDRGYCIFFDQNAKSCFVHPVRPKEAESIKCWQKDTGRDRSLWGTTWWKVEDILRFLPDFNPKPYEGNKYIPPKASMAPRRY